MEVRKEKQEIWNKEEKAVKSEEEARTLLSEKLHKQIHIFRKKASEQISTRKLWDHVIDTKKGFVPRKRKMYLLSRKEKKEVHKFISEQLRKEYIRPLKLLQMAPVFFIGKKDGKK